MLRLLWCLCFVLSACSLRPVYQQPSTDEAAPAHSLPGIAVEVMPESRPAQLLRIALEDLLRQSGDESVYRLVSRLEYERYPIGIERSGRISRYNLSFSLNYQLVEQASGRQVTSGTLRKLSSYNEVVSDFASYMAEKDAVRRGVDELAAELRNRLILVLKEPRA